MNKVAACVAHTFAWAGDDAAKLSAIFTVHPCSCQVISETPSASQYWAV
jgi:hypothetical protein